MQGLEHAKQGCAIAFFDIDGTLTRRVVQTGNLYEMPSEETTQALYDFVQAGNLAFLSSGRSPKGLAHFMDDLPFSGFIAIDGSYVELAGEALVDTPFPQDVIWGLIEEAFEFDVCLAFEGRDDDLVVNHTGSRVDPRRIINSLEEVRRIVPEPYMGKANFHGPDYEVLSKKSTWLDKVQLFEAGAGAWEIAPIGVGKDLGAQAIVEALNKKGITTGKVLAFGDSENDLPVLHMADIAVVMGDAADNVKDEAQLITEDAANSGVGHALRQLEHIWR